MTELRDYEKGEGKDWNVKETIAYGRGEVHKDFQGLQRDLNAFAPSMGYEALDVDGFLGPKSVDAIGMVYTAVVMKNPLLRATVFPIPKTKEEVAEWAQFIRDWLKETAAKTLEIAEVGA